MERTQVRPYKGGSAVALLPRSFAPDLYVVLYLVNFVHRNATNSDALTSEVQHTCLTGVGKLTHLVKINPSHG